jgi:hypothetical protein
MVNSTFTRVCKCLSVVIVLFLCVKAIDPDLALLRHPHPWYRLAFVELYLLAGWVTWILSSERRR